MLNADLDQFSAGGDTPAAALTMALSSRTGVCGKREGVDEQIHSHRFFRRGGDRGACSRRAARRTAGVGLGLAGTVDDADCAFNFGAGVKLFLTPRIAIRAKARRFLQDVTTTLAQVELVGGTLVEIPEPLNERVAVTTLNVGLSFFFGGR